MPKEVDNVNRSHAPQPDDVLELVHAVMHLYRSQQFRSLRDTGQGVTHMESKVLGFFARHPGATQSDLVAHTQRDKGQLARLITSLRERELLEAKVDEQDRRILRLQLSADGVAAAQALRRQARRVSAVAVNGIDDAERAQLVTLLERVRANLAAQDDSGEAP